MFTGHHLIHGQWVAGDDTFTSTPVTGDGLTVSKGTAAHIDQAAQVAENAFWTYGWTTAADRAKFLRTIADEIEARGAALTEIAMAETGLPEMRLNGERGRTTGQLRVFADHIEKGDYLDHRHDVALPDRAPLPRPDLKMTQRPIGPVGVFGASNFPLAFSVAGGDTAAALAAGCPVVVKGHEAHPGTSEIVAQAILAAIEACDMPRGVFALVQGGSIDTGVALAQHSLINAIGFTGSLRGGKALFDICAAREVPIPFFGELGSVNPMFILPDAAATKAAEIGAGWAGSLTMGVGQFCTNPGLSIIIDGPEADAYIAAMTEGLAAVAEQNMLTRGIAAAYEAGVAAVETAADVKTLIRGTNATGTGTPAFFETTGQALMSNHLLSEEVFGPLGIVVRVKDMEEMIAVAKSFVGQLTATLHMTEADKPTAAKLLPILERKAGRVLANGFPTGVEVADAMVHGGPYPASTNFGATSVGTLAIRRFLRPVCYQNLDASLLP